MEMERPEQEAIDAFVTLAGVSEHFAVQKLQEHGGDLNSALDAYFAESNENNVPVTHVTAPRQDSRQLADADDFRSEFQRISAGGILDSLFGTNNARSMFHEPTFFPSLAIDERIFNRSSIFDRIPLFPEHEPVVSHPREVREIPIEVKDSNGWSSNSRHIPTILDVTDTEHDHGPGISGVVTMEDDDYASENDMPSRTTQVDYASDNDITARFAQTVYLDDAVLEEQLILAANEASRREAEEKQSAKSFETAMDLDLVEDADAEERHLESDKKLASLPQEPLPDENGVVNIIIRMSDGCRLNRRFLKSDKLKVVFDFIQICGGVHPGSYKLARSYPGCTFSAADGSLTLEEIGMTSKQEALYLENL